MPSRLRIDLFELELLRCNRFSSFVEDEESRAGRALINGTNEGLGYAAHGYVEPDGDEDDCTLRARGGKAVSNASLEDTLGNWGELISH